MEELIVDLRPRMVSIQFIMKMFSCLLFILDKVPKYSYKVTGGNSIVLTLCGM